MTYREIRAELKRRIKAETDRLEASISRCSWCGGYFFADGKSVHCSPECSKETAKKHKRNWWNHRKEDSE